MNNWVKQIVAAYSKHLLFKILSTIKSNKNNVLFFFQQQPK